MNDMNGFIKSQAFALKGYDVWIATERAAGTTPKDFLDNLDKSDFFRQFWVLAFMGGMEHASEEMFEIIAEQKRKDFGIN